MLRCVTDRRRRRCCLLITHLILTLGAAHLISISAADLIIRIAVMIINAASVAFQTDSSRSGVDVMLVIAAAAAAAVAADDHRCICGSIGVFLVRCGLWHWLERVAAIVTGFRRRRAA